MEHDKHWAPLLEELDRWHAAGKRASFWLRDDDAIEPTPALDRLLQLAGRHDVPVALAVIPAHTGEPLARRLENAPHATVTVHGWSHHNHAPPDEKKQELGGHRPAETVIAELADGFTLLSSLHAERFVPVLVPPWNRIDGRLFPHLGPLGFEALSIYGPEKNGAFRQINTHVDLMDWHGARGGRDHAVLATEITKRLATTFDRGGTVGLLTHHLVHDERAWNFLERFFAVTAAHPACDWRAIGGILDANDE